MTTSLATPLTLPCGVVIPNRICKSAMTEGIADSLDHATDKHVNLYRTWSHGGAGLQMSGNIMVDHRYLERPGNVVVQDRTGYEQLKKWASAATEYGNHFWAQVSHPGRQCARISSGQPLSPSDVQLNMLATFARPRAMNEEDIQDAIERYIRTAVILKDAGFTGIQFHAAHGYLISQFLSPITNKRTDKWGGTLENRARFLLTIVRKGREALGLDFPIGVKLNSADFQKGGFTLSESAQVAKWLSDEKIDLLEISGGTYEQIKLLGHTGEKSDIENPEVDRNIRESTRQREAYFLEYAKTIQDAIEVPLMVTGGFRSRENMQEALANIELDMIGIARPLCVDPDVPKKLISGEMANAQKYAPKLWSGAFGPASNSKVFRMVNIFGDVAWYYHQILKLSENKALNPNIGLLRSFFSHFSREYKIGIKRKWVQRKRINH